MHIPKNESEQVLSVQHGVNCRREESQISEPGDATIREKAPNPFHLIRREAVSFANLKTFVPYSPFGRSLFGHGFSLRRLVSAPSPRHRGRPTVGFTIARIIWQGWASAFRSPRALIAPALAKDTSTIPSRETPT